MTQVLPERIKKHLRVGGDYALFHRGPAAKSQYCLPSRLFRRHPSRNVVRRAHFDMRAQFRLDLLVQLRTTK